MDDSILDAFAVFYSWKASVIDRNCKGTKMVGWDVPSPFLEECFCVR